MAIIQDAITSLMGEIRLMTGKVSFDHAPSVEFPLPSSVKRGVTDAVRQCMNTLTGIPPG